MPQPSNWAARERRPLLSLRADLIGDECLVDRYGGSHCQHDHEAPAAPPLDFQDVIAEIPGWTAQQG